MPASMRPLDGRRQTGGGEACRSVPTPASPYDIHVWEGSERGAAARDPGPRGSRSGAAVSLPRRAEATGRCERLAAHGALLFRGFDVADAPAFERVARAIDAELKNEYLGTSPRNALTEPRLHGERAAAVLPDPAALRDELHRAPAAAPLLLLPARARAGLRRDAAHGLPQGAARSRPAAGEALRGEGPADRAQLRRARTAAAASISGSSSAGTRCS